MIVEYKTDDGWYIQSTHFLKLQRDGKVELGRNAQETTYNGEPVLNVYSDTVWKKVVKKRKYSKEPQSRERRTGTMQPRPIAGTVTNRGIQWAENPNFNWTALHAPITPIDTTHPPRGAGRTGRTTIRVEPPEDPFPPPETYDPEYPPITRSEVFRTLYHRCGGGFINPSHINDVYRDINNMGEVDDIDKRRYLRRIRQDILNNRRNTNEQDT